MIIELREFLISLLRCIRMKILNICVQRVEKNEITKKMRK